MRSLFLKIFVWFWLAMTLVILAGFLSAIATFREDGRGPGGPRHLTMYATTAVEKFERDGQIAARNYLNLLEESTRTRAYLFDGSGNEITGRTMSPETEAFARSVGNEWERRPTPTRGGETELTSSGVTGPSGQRYVLVGEIPRPPRMFPPFFPRVWWAPLIAVMLTAGVLCYGLARYISSPLTQLRGATQQLAAGDLTARVGAAGGKRRDELADLGRDFDIMAERMQTLMATQQRLLHDISHELRSPLSRLNIALELARQGHGPEVEWALDRIEREAGRLSDLISQLLTLARLESDSSVSENTLVDIKRLVDDVEADADFEARSHNRKVRVVTNEECTTYGNESLLRSAIENVVRNGVFHTPEGTEVEIAVRRQSDDGISRAIISVRDHGAGVPQGALANIFRPFYRVAEARDRQSGGYGLGLSISQRAVKIHGGTIVASNAEAGGLLIEIVLPITLNGAQASTG
jgi:two-component system sensor histidine kinase CpxA